MPSVITDDLCSYLHALAETRVEAAPPHDNETKRSEFQEQATTLTERVQTLIRTIPVESQKVGVSLEWFRIRLRGRYAKHALAGDVAGALRAVGWVRRRGWREAEHGFRAKWYPRAHPDDLQEPPK